MKLAIHNSQTGFHPRWVSYCKQNNINYKIVDCYANNIIEQLKDCDALMWHHHHTNPKDVLFAKQLLYSIEQSGKIVFPDFNTGWHFDDKLGQKYLFEALNLPLIPSYVFYDKKTANEWANKATYPKVWKLRGGAGASNVKLVKNKNEAFCLINKAFNKGFKQYNALGTFKDKWKRFINRKGTIKDVIKGVVRLIYPPYYAKIMGREIGYIYFQDFIPNNKFDIRLVVVGNKAAGERRYVRNNDFRASGSGKFSYEDISTDVVKVAFDVSKKLNLQSVAFDFVYDQNNNPLIVELSYGFGTKGIDNAPGYWDSNLNWHEGQFNPQGWMVESVIKEIKNKSINHV